MGMSLRAELQQRTQMRCGGRGVCAVCGVCVVCAQHLMSGLIPTLNLPGVPTQWRHSTGVELPLQPQCVGLLQCDGSWRSARVCRLTVWTHLLLGGEPGHC